MMLDMLAMVLMGGARGHDLVWAIGTFSISRILIWATGSSAIFFEAAGVIFEKDVLLFG
jgi:hypothetical protein